MTSKEVYEYLKDEKSVAKLYKLFEKSFQLMDRWSEIFIKGDLLDENQLGLVLDQSTGVYGKLCPVANAIESYMERLLQNAESKYYSEQEKINAQAVSVAKANARASVNDIRDYLGDFKGYLSASQQNILSAQSRLKRLVVEAGAKRIAHHGEVNNESTAEKNEVKDDGTSAVDINQSAWEN